ncbi:sigma-70 family RNA polymerase sigma factor [Cellulomonas sp. NPDC089187]|uniref:RNA polymerase sigma factor n=1 Tax=Cellulomonas sp. NPDC089187 TaxID=3154970 RepID=UPI00343AC61C
MLAQLDDSQLCAAVRDGDTAAFEVLYRRHSGWVREVAARRVGAAEAEDVVADTFAAVLSALRRGRGPEGPIGPYLTTAVRRRISRHLKASDRTVYTGDLIDVLESDATSTGPSVEEAVLASVDGADASAAFAQLRPRDQRVLELVELEGLGYQQAAEVLDVPVATLGHMLFTARSALYDAWVAQHIPGSGEDHPHALDLARFVTGTAGARIRRRISSHLETCPSCGLRIGELGTPAHRPARRASAVGLLAVLPVWYRIWTYGRSVRGKTLLIGGRPPVELLIPGVGLLAAVGLLTGVPEPAVPLAGSTSTPTSVSASASPTQASAAPASVSAAWEPGVSVAGAAVGEQLTLPFVIRAEGDRSDPVTLVVEAGPGVSIVPAYSPCALSGSRLSCDWIGPLMDGAELHGQIVVRVDDPTVAQLPALSVTRG